MIRWQIVAMDVQARGQAEDHDVRKVSRGLLARARERQAQERKLLAEGVDPMTLRKAKKRAEHIAVKNSFASVAARWLEHWQDGKRLRLVGLTKRDLDSNILPSLGALQVTEIEAPEVVAMVRLIEKRLAYIQRTMRAAGRHRGDWISNPKRTINKSHCSNNMPGTTSWMRAR